MLLWKHMLAFLLFNHDKVTSDRKGPAGRPCNTPKGINTLLAEPNRSVVLIQIRGQLRKAADHIAEGVG
jgi:hypothetical protein